MPQLLRPTESTAGCMRSAGAYEADIEVRLARFVWRGTMRPIGVVQRSYPSWRGKVRTREQDVVDRSSKLLPFSRSHVPLMILLPRAAF